KPDRCVIRRSEADRVFAQTTVATGIRRHHQTVVNNGLPANLGGATTTTVIALRPRHVETPYGNRERFEANGRTLAIPQTTALAPVAAASTHPGPGGETRHASTPAPANNPAQNQAARNVLAQRAPVSQPSRHLNPSVPAPVKMAAYTPASAAPASPAASAI